MRLKLTLIILGLAASAAAILFLIFDHKDTLINEAPADTVIYLHASNKNWQELKKQKPEVINYLIKSTGLSENEADYIFKNKTNETALIQRSDNNWYWLTANTPEILGLVTDDNIQAATSSKSQLFPLRHTEIRPNLGKLTENLKLKPRIFDFSEIKIYFSGEPIVFLPSEVLGGATGVAFWAGVTLKSEVITIKTTLAGPELTRRGTLPHSEGSRLILNNFNPAKFMSQNVGLIPENLAYLLLKNLDETVQVDIINTEKPELIIYIRKPEKSLQEITSLIIELAAQIYPVRKTVELPDGSQAIHLIADTNAFNFTAGEINLGRRTHDLVLPTATISIMEVPHQDTPTELVVVLAQDTKAAINRNTVFKSQPKQCGFFNHEFLWLKAMPGVNVYLSKSIWGNVDICID